MPIPIHGAKLAGVAGIDLLRHGLAIADFGCETFELRDPKNVTAEIADGDATRIKAGSIRDGKQLTLPVTINGVSGVAVLDTGARYTDINQKFAAAAGITPESSAFRDARPTRGITMKSIETRVGPIGTVRFAGMTRRDAIARVVDLPYFKEAGWADGPAMNLGVDFLHDMRLTVDFSARRFWLAPSICPSPISGQEPVQ